MMRLKAVAESRFASCINTIDLELEVGWPASKISKDTQDIVSQAVTCKQVDVCLSPLYAILVFSLKRTTNLRSFIIRPPSEGSFRTFEFLVRDRLLETATQQTLGGLDKRGLSHGYIEGFHSPSTLYHSVFAAIAFTKLKLDRLELRGSSINMIQQRFAPTLHLYRSLVLHHSWVRNVSSLTLQLDIFPVHPFDAAAALDRIFKSSVNLAELSLDLRPTCDWITTDAERRVVCHQLMNTLGSPCQFRLRKLDLSGLRADSAAVLARIIHVHVAYFRTLVLFDAQFEHGSTIPLLLDMLADSQTDRLEFQKLHTGTTLFKALLPMTLKEDNLTCLTWNDGMDLGYKDWVDVAWNGVDNAIV
jgi:hypothetical protein